MGRSPPSDDPRRLQDRLADGEPAAFAEVYENFGDRLYRAAARLLGRGDEAEEVVQELFVSLVRSRAPLRGVGNLSAYLFVSLRRLIGRSVERRRRAPQPHAEQLDQIADSPRTEISSELREDLNAALAALPAEQREVVVMKIDAELTFAEIGEVLQISPNTAASRYRYALEKLRQRLGIKLNQE
jgi:RNA polymerase sigma-70 factor (ECF subfamily)